MIESSPQGNELVAFESNMHAMQAEVALCQLLAAIPDGIPGIYVERVNADTEHTRVTMLGRRQAVTAYHQVIDGTVSTGVQFKGRHGNRPHHGASMLSSADSEEITFRAYWGERLTDKDSKIAYGPEAEQEFIEAVDTFEALIAESIQKNTRQAQAGSKLARLLSGRRKSRS